MTAPQRTPTQGRALKICELIALGHALPDICNRPGFPSQAQFVKWCQLDPAIARMYDTGRRISAYMLEEEALSLARAGAENPGSPGALKAREQLIQQLRWAATKRNPGVFSDKAAVTVTVPIQINTSLDLGADPTASAKGIDNVYTLTSETVQEAPIDDDRALQQLVKPVVEQKLAAAEARVIAKKAKQRERMKRLREERKREAARDPLSA